MAQSVKKRAVEYREIPLPNADETVDIVVGAGTDNPFPNASEFMDNYVGPDLGTGDETEGE